MKLAALGLGMLAKHAVAAKEATGTVCLCWHDEPHLRAPCWLVVSVLAYTHVAQVSLKAA
jgi:hypothetical protein